MCLTIPGKITSIKEGKATVENGSRSEQIDLGVFLDAKVGDWVLYATERAVRLIDEQEAREIIALLEDNYQPVDIAALPLPYKKIIYKVRNPKFEARSTRQIQNSKSQKEITNIKPSVAIARTGDDAIYQKDRHASLAMTKSDLEYLLKLKGRNNLEALYSEANVLRKEIIEDFVCIHGIIEFSNYCKNDCLYCGIRQEANIRRYRMNENEILAAAKVAVNQDGYKLIVLQSGEDYSYSDDDLVALIKRIKKVLRVFIFISVGERSRDFYQRAFEVGASGSLFRFETSNPELYAKMHPGHTLEERLTCLKDQIEIGYYVATGGLIGLPGQTVSDLANDLLLVKELGIPMLSSGPWIPSGNTPLGNPKSEIRNPKIISNSTFHNMGVIPSALPERQAPEESHNRVSDKEKKILHFVQNDNIAIGQLSKDERLRLSLNYIAAARLLMPEIKIPITTALETLDPESGRHRGLLAGANALMFNITPEKYRADYNLYDHKYIEREKVWQKYGLFKGEESYEMLEERLMI